MLDRYDALKEDRDSGPNPTDQCKRRRSGDKWLQVRWNARANGEESSTTCHWRPWGKRTAAENECVVVKEVKEFTSYALVEVAKLGLPDRLLLSTAHYTYSPIPAI